MPLCTVCVWCVCVYLHINVCMPVCICFSFTVAMLAVLEAEKLLSTVFKTDIKSNYLLLEED